MARTGQDSEWISGLLDPAAFPHPVARLRLIETHISWVVLTGQYAYKVKKPVRLGFLDFSTLEQRKYFCEEELRLNRRTAPDLYLEVVVIGAWSDGLRIGLQPAVEYAVRMRQFPADARLDLRLRAGRVSVDDIRETARRIAAFHNGLEPRRTSASASAAKRATRPALNNFRHMNAGFFDATERAELAALEAWTRRRAEALAPCFSERAANGMIRDCHGDLHLANLFEQDGSVVPFDCLEFNPDLSCIDQASDVAFLVMDLAAQGRTDYAYTLLNSWLEETGDYAALAVLRFYLVYRSLVRVKVASIQLQQVIPEASSEPALDARRYLDLANALIHPPAPPRLVLMHGVSGSGKTRVSGELLQFLPAIRVRSDVERKRLHGMPSLHGDEAPPGKDLYGPDATERTYARLAEHCRTGLLAGFDMIADATFLDAKQRRRFVTLAETAGARPVIVHCTAGRRVLEARVRRRAIEGRDASDAGLAVLEQQLSRAAALGPDEQRLTIRVDTDRRLDCALLARSIRA